MSRHLPAARKAGALFLLGILTAGLAFPPGARASLRLPPHQKKVLPNGLTILLLEQRGIPLVSFAALVKSGATADPAGREGLASVTAAALRKGTKTRTADQFSAELDFIGGTFSAAAAPDYTSISAEFMSKDAKQGIELVADALLDPVFPKEEVAKLLRQGIDGIRAEKDEARGVLTTYFNSYLFARHPYGRPSEGDENSLAAITREDVSRFYENYYTPSNTILIAAGDFSSAEMEKLLVERFGGWADRKAPGVSLAMTAPAQGRRLLLVDKPDSTQTFFTIGNVGVSRSDPDRIAIRVVNTLFGGRFTSLLNSELRIKSGLTYGAFSFFDSRRVPGPFLLFSYTKNETTAQAMDLALDVLKRAHEQGFTEQELASAKNYMKGQFPPTIETADRLASLLGELEFYGLDDSEVNDFEAKVDAVTPAVARRVIAQHYPLDNLVFVLIGKSSEIREAVKKYAARMDTRTITEPGFWKEPAAGPGK